MKGETKVVLISDSINEKNQRLSTFELTIPRMIWAEFLTHRVFSRNASSSRAVPIFTQAIFILFYLFVPEQFPKNNKGMSPERGLNWVMNKLATLFWYIGVLLNVTGSLIMKSLGVHKEIANRQTEYFSYTKAIVTATEWINFLHLRTHSAAQKEIRIVANLIRDLLKDSEPELLSRGEWHTPYVDHYRDEDGRLLYGIKDSKGGVEYIDEYKAIAISVSCAAQVSYRKRNRSVIQCIRRFEKFKNNNPKHSSPFEHCATPVTGGVRFNGGMSKGTTHVDMKGDQWSGNLKGWIQYRQLL